MSDNKKILAIKLSPRFNLHIAEEILLLPPADGVELPPLDGQALQYSLPEMRQHFPEITGSKGHGELDQSEFSNHLAQLVYDGECWRRVASGEPIGIEYSVGDPAFENEHLRLDLRVVDKNGDVCRIAFASELHVVLDDWTEMGRAVGRFENGRADVAIAEEWLRSGRLLLYFFYEKDRTASARIVLNEELLYGEQQQSGGAQGDRGREAPASP